MNQRKRRAEAEPPRILHDDAYRAQVLVIADADATREAKHQWPRDRSEDWWERAACRGLDTSLFFPVRGESTAEAEAVCSGCPVRDDCLWFALGDHDRTHGAQHTGVWGGTSERGRQKLRRAARAQGGLQ